MPFDFSLESVTLPVRKKVHSSFQGTNCMNKAVANRLFATLVTAATLLAGTSQAEAQASAPAKGETPKTTEQKTAEQVFKNIQVLKGTPADQLQTSMQFISNSLGVECEFCHVSGAFEKDEKKPKDKQAKKDKKARKNKVAKDEEPSPDEPIVPEAGSSGRGLTFSWKQHPSVRYGDLFRLDVEAKLQEDGHSSYGPVAGLDPWEFHRNRFGVKGYVTKHIEYEIEHEFTEKELTEKDIEAGVTPKSR
jgi:hypothetical protein